MAFTKLAQVLQKLLHLAGVSCYTWQVCPVTPDRCVLSHL